MNAIKFWGSIAAVVFGLFFMANKVSSYECTIKSESFEDHRYSMIGGCMVKHNGRWLPLDNIRGFE